MTAPHLDSFLDLCRAAVGPQHVLTEAADKAPYLTDWRQRYTGDAVAVLRPGSTEEVAALVHACHAHKLAVVPQGGNTGLCGGATPEAGPAAAAGVVVLSLQRMNRVRHVDPLNNTITVEAGVILQQLQDVAREHGRLFPLSLAAEGSCTIGGNLSTNAGGTAVLRYGNTRELCLGLEVVTARGEVWDGLRGLRKDNTGYDLRDLFIGAEGTLGIITAAVMKLYPLPRARVTALAAVQSPRAALALLAIAQSHASAMLTGFELMSAMCMDLVRKHYPQLRYPFTAATDAHPQLVLLELSDSEGEAHARAIFETMMEAAFEAGVVTDAVVAESVQQSRDFWNLREHIPMAQVEEGKNIKHDIAVPVSRVADFIETTDALVQDAFPGARMVTFGHLGDGNLHYNVSPPVGVDHEQFLIHQDAINLIVHNSVQSHNGSISAEHGLGQLKREENRRYKSEVELGMMRAIKQALDPQGLMNPGKVL
ncbi:putative FAD-linked oxidoreductase [Cupriavidus campinensis]|uniref:FAD-binding oxidoreductase n=1 Tax=Cupriavidus campinensis TaxID=151783 RepID=A0AAE9I3D0_9BURK|nr:MULTISPECIES: FAD-binding oxidoreductase [Cupriavidus]TSP14587.1 FAD-binding oxidoreductase [Cupriavidus campinensis]URF05317.1 FAD-binding oxidoreductase [Cupriavidus campinensis]CAG2137582.1 putative FAD-linked oxidoreductase [Cupriavidus campinensis]